MQRRSVMADIGEATLELQEQKECRPGERGASGWREAAVVEVLGRGVNDMLEPFLASIRENLPNSNQAVVWGVKFRRAAEILRRETEVEDDIVRGAIASYVEERGGFGPYLAWGRFCWDGEEVEALSIPRLNSNALVFFSGSREAAEGAAAFVGERAQVPRSRCLLFSGTGWREAPELEDEIDGASWDGIVLPKETLSAIRNSFGRFFERREEYRALGVPWRRGLLLVGPTGTGKTSVVKALAASRPDLPFLYVRDLDAMGGARAIGNIFGRARKLSPSILALEDIDGLVNGANRSIFLNELDGFGDNDGVFVLASSNHPERIDEALLKRPSRFDRVFHLGLPTFKERKEYLTRLLSAPPLYRRFPSGRETEEAADRLAESSEGLAPAHIKEAVLSAALGLTEDAEDGGREEAFEDLVLSQIGRLKTHLKTSGEELGEMRPPGSSMGFGNRRRPGKPQR